MSKLYEILKKLEQHKEIAASPVHMRRQEGAYKKWTLLPLIFLLSFLLGFYAFKTFLSPEGRPLAFKRTPSVALVKETPRVTAKPKKTVKSPRPPQKRPSYALARANSERQSAAQEMALPRYHKERVSSYPPLGTKEILRGLLVRAEGLRKEGKCQEAIKLYQAYLKHRKDAAVLNNYGACLLLMGDLEGAERAFKQSLRRANDPLTRLNLVIVEIKEKKFSQACLEFKKIKDKSSPLYQEVSQIMKSQCKQ